ncbi:MAG: ADP-ribosylation factor-like protein [Nostoc sp.]|uniref:ADP-ribosylation factor-like protein n=1 Tax=Nostoc sp. TaxID=1180 RepID=UPI002FF7B567
MKRKVFFYTGLAIVTMLCVWFIASIPNPNLVQVLAALIPPIIVGIFIEYTQRLRDKLYMLLEKSPFKNKNCTILLIGSAGSGKSSLANCWGFPDVNSTTTTDSFQTYIKSEKDFKITLLDYRGQDLTQITTELDSKYRENIFAAIFVVDVVAREDENKNPLLTPDQQIKWLSYGSDDETYKKIKNRVYAHSDFFGIAGIQGIFNVIYSLKLRHVMFLINKYDLIEKLLDKLPDSYISDPEESIKKEFSDFQNKIWQFCKNVDYPIRNLTIDVISVSRGTNTNKIYAKIVDDYKKWLDKYGWVEERD